MLGVLAYECASIVVRRLLCPDFCIAINTIIIFITDKSLELAIAFANTEEGVAELRRPHQ